MDSIKLQNLKQRDFLAYEDNFSKTKSIESVLRVGSYWDKNPTVSIVIPVYKRPELASVAIKSIINQVEFEDYQLIVVDDEATGDVVNPIESIIKNIGNSHILYFKNSKNLGLYANWNRCVLLARSKWICMVHTDTFLKKDYLNHAFMVLKNNPQIKFLCFNKDDIELSRPEDLDFEKLYTRIDKVNRYSYFDFYSYNFSMRSCIQGGIFDRDSYIKIGGIKSDGSIVEDFPFMAKFAYHYGIYYDYSKTWIDCSYDNFGSNPSIWQEQLVYNYYLYKFISLKRKLFKRTFRKNAIIRVNNEANKYLNGTSWIKKKCDIDVDKLNEECSIISIPSLSIVDRFVLAAERKISNMKVRRKINRII